ncbi:MAG: hypothetical protein KJ558_03515 [Gammaproteobacteria bacterium]|nr:hypothetical protein [Gammaproteobacteria bacterium]MBU1653893.1 hypothetical protein [Gammaproteobacteria bacterium]MBU1961381.1 hypothetical protein [Gammaproteobacteria bacterium]
MSLEDEFLHAFRGSFTSALRWHHLDALWGNVQRDAGGGWYIYALGEEPPESPSDAVQVALFLEEMDRLLREEHAEDYCGIVYADDLSDPSFIKIYDPHNLGVSCGYSKNPPLPGWVMCKIPPVKLDKSLGAAKSRQRWWRELWHGDP